MLPEKMKLAAQKTKEAAERTIGLLRKAPTKLKLVATAGLGLALFLGFSGNKESKKYQNGGYE